MPSWTYTGKRVKGSVEAVTIFGTRIGKSQAKAQYQGEITRHHLIDIQTLQALWNAIVDRNDEDTMEALAVWAGARIPNRPFNMGSTNPPNGLLNKIAWNPFNLVVGPLTNYRVGDPGDSFDDLHFRSFPKFTDKDRSNQAESIARQEFNAHIYRLKQIDQLGARYINGDVPEQVASSLRMLLRSDTPTHYPNLRNGLGTAGALLHPALWEDYSLTSNRWFAKTGDDKKYDNAIAAKMVPYVARSFFPEILVKPKDQNTSVREDLKAPPTSPPAVLIPTSERRLFTAATCQPLLEEKIAPYLRFATGGGVRVLICAKKEDGLFRDLTANVGAAVKKLVQDKGWKLTYSPMARPEYGAAEVRIYLK
ncbi:MAG TPA: hypothetical protein VN914_08385 [Polyangia bacterium]|nr:hypothetical protein [Polyangia bacterium]